MDEFAVAEIDSRMPDVSRALIEIQAIARLQFGDIDRLSDLILLSRRARQFDAVAAEDSLHEERAINIAGQVSAILIRDAQVFEGRLQEGGILCGRRDLAWVAGAASVYPR